MGKWTFPPEGWLTALMATLLDLLVANGSGTIGIILVEIVEEFRCDKAEAAAIGAIQVSLYTIGAVVFGEFIARFGCKRTGVMGAALVSGGYIGAAYCTNIPSLCVSLGFVAGLGFSCWLLAANVAVQRNCTQWRSLASGILFAGSSIGFLIFPPWTELLIRKYTWRGALLINAGITLHGLPFSMLLTPFRSDTQKVKSSKEGGIDDGNEFGKIGDKVERNSDYDVVPFETFEEKEEDTQKYARDTNDQMFTGDECISSNQQTSDEVDIVYSRRCGTLRQAAYVYVTFLKTPKILLLIICTALIHFGHPGPFTYLPMRGADIHLSKKTAAMLVFTLGIVGAIGRIGFGLIGNYLSNHRMLMYSLSGISTGVSSILSIFVFNSTGLFAYAAAFALFSGCYMGFMSVVLTDMVGTKKLPQLLTLTFPLLGIFQLISISTSGMIIDATSNVAAPFIYLGSVQLLGGVLAFVVWKIDAQHQKQQTEPK